MATSGEESSEIERFNTLDVLICICTQCRKIKCVGKSSFIPARNCFKEN